MEHMKEIESNLAYSHVITSEHIQARVKSEVTDHPIPNSCLLVYDTYNRDMWINATLWIQSELSDHIIIARILISVFEIHYNQIEEIMRYVIDKSNICILTNHKNTRSIFLLVNRVEVSYYVGVELQDGKTLLFNSLW